MPTAAARKQPVLPVLLLVGVLVAGLAFLARLGTAAPDFDLMGQLAGQRFGMEGRRAIVDWRRFLDTAGKTREEEQLQAVNEFFNRRVQFGSDQAIWGQHDYWATPLETLGRSRGDCEDFAIAKYVTLRLLGVPGEKLRLTYVKARIGGMYSQITQAHMVLAYYPAPTAEPLVLDNLISEIRPASQRRDLQPVFSFGMENLWVGASAMPAANATARLSRWRDVLSRMRAEGLNVLFDPEQRVASRPQAEKPKEKAVPARAAQPEKKQEAQPPAQGAARPPAEERNGEEKESVHVVEEEQPETTEPAGEVEGDEEPETVTVESVRIAPPDQAPQP